MTWSTREIAEITGTTVRTVRHYHDVGLLRVPERSSNGYKAYEVSDLLTLIRIRQLVDLGLSLPEIATVTAGDLPSADALRRLDAKLADEMARLQQTRDKVAVLLQDGAHASDLGVELAPIAHHALTRPDRAFLVLLARVVAPHVLDAYLTMIEATRSEPALAELDALAPDAPEDERASLAARMATHLTGVYATFPDLRDVTVGAKVEREEARRVLERATSELYNPAQVDVIGRASRLAVLPADAPVT